MMMHASEAEVIGILDWELSTLGCPLADFAYLCRPYRDALRELILSRWVFLQRRRLLRRIVSEQGALLFPTGTTILPLICSRWRPSCKGSLGGY